MYRRKSKSTIEILYENWHVFHDNILDNFMREIKTEFSGPIPEYYVDMAWNHYFINAKDDTKLFSYALTALFNKNDILSNEEIVNTIVKLEEFEKIHEITANVSEKIPRRWLDKKFKTKKSWKTFWKKTNPKYNKFEAILEMISYMMKDIEEFVSGIIYSE